jgi:hypothetical protein
MSDIDMNHRMYVHRAHETLLKWQQVREHTTRMKAGGCNSNRETSHNHGRWENDYGRG